MTLLTPAPTKAPSYAQWVRRAISRIGASRGQIVTLFDSNVPEPVELLRATIAKGFAGPITSRYTSAFVNGNPYVVQWIARTYGVEADSILCTTGATRALSLLYGALVGEGGRVLVETPGFDLFEGAAVQLGIGVDYFRRTGADFAIDVAQVEACLRPRTQLVVLSNLHNPSGMALSVDVLRDLAALAERRDFHVVVDEVYQDYAEAGGQPPVRAAEISPRLISISSLTKIFGLSTLRCGWIVAAPEVIAPVRDWAEQAEFGISNLAHAVAALVLDDRQSFMDYSLTMLERSRPVIASYHQHWIAEGLVEGDLPDHGCITFPRLPDIADTETFSDWLADRCGVLVAPGEYFYAPGHIRIGFGAPAGSLDYALDALTDGLKTYRDKGIGR